jgi:glycosyltransferase involved in cell wall biosynthesis
VKIVHLITRLDPGGSAENTNLTCRHLQEAGWDVVLATGPGKGALENTGEEARLRTVLIPALRRDPAPLHDLTALLQIVRLLRRERPDIVHTHSAKGGILGRWAGRLARVPHVVHTPHGHVIYGYARGAKNWLYLTAERLTAPLTDRLVALSDGERRESIEHGIGRSSQWIVIPSGIEMGSLLDQAEKDTGAPGQPTRAAREGRPLRIGTIARLEHVKGVDVLIEAAKELHDMCSQSAGVTTASTDTDLPDAAPERPQAPGLGFEISIWGEGDLHEELEALAARLSVEALVRFEGVSRPVLAFLQDLDIYVQPSRNEGMGRALAMAQATGLPAVATRVCGIPDVVRDGETGLLADSEDPLGLAEHLFSLLEDDRLRAHLARGARSWMMSTDESGEPRFSVEAMLWHLDRLYEELMAGDS